MSALGEKTLFALLTDTDACEYLAQHGINLRIIPTEVLRPVVEFALDHYNKSGKAPSEAVLRVEFDDVLNDAEVAIDVEVEETIEWAVEDLTAGYAKKASHDISVSLATELAEAATDQKVSVIGDHASRLTALHMSLQPRRTQVDLRQAGHTLVDDYDVIVASGNQIQGMRLGMPQIDAYTKGIREGELAILSGPPKSTKSYALNYVAAKEWESGRVVGLWTLENSIQMTQMRIACQVLHLDIEDLYSGTLSGQDYRTLREWVEDVLLKADVPLYIFHPEISQRTPSAITAMAGSYGIQSLIIDQLTFMEPDEARRGYARSGEVRSILHSLKSHISTGRNQMSCLLANQITREGVKRAEKTGYFVMYDQADSAETERTADWVFGLYASTDMAAMGRMTWQTLATRRGTRSQHFDLIWRIAEGHVYVRNTVEL